MELLTYTNDSGVMAKTGITADWPTSTIQKVVITVPTHVEIERNSYSVTYSEINDNTFYNILLHEIGHAIGLAHATENEEGLIDPMFEYIDTEEGRRTISVLHVMTLQPLYR